MNWLGFIIAFLGGLLLGMNIIIWSDIIKLREGKRLAELDLELSKTLEKIR